MDDKIKLICPQCHAGLIITRRDGIEEKLLQCPKCQYKARVSVYMQGSAAAGGVGSNDEHTQIATGGSTQVSGPQMPPELTVGALFIDRHEYKLVNGDNIVGRSAPTSKATIRITEIDEYMSREHAHIVTRVNAAGMQHLLSPINPRNPIYINGNRIDAGDEVILKFGDKIRMGHTELIFERPGYLNDQTQYQG